MSPYLDDRSLRCDCVLVRDEGGEDSGGSHQRGSHWPRTAWVAAVAGAGSPQVMVMCPGHPSDLPGVTARGHLGGKQIVHAPGGVCMVGAWSALEHSPGFSVRLKSFHNTVLAPKRKC